MDSSDCADSLDKVFSGTNDYHWREPHPAVARLLQSIAAPRAGSVLDLGCGYGRHTLLAASMGFSVTAMDVSPVALAFVRDRVSGVPGVSMQQHDMSSVPYPFGEGKFDLVIAIQVIHHQASCGVEATLAEINRILKPGGLALVSLPSRLQQGPRWEMLDDRTAIAADGPERGIVHFLCPEEDSAHRLFEPFEVESIALDQWDHWCVLARRPWGADV